jgi:hypothetical protein
LKKLAIFLLHITLTSCWLIVPFFYAHTSQHCNNQCQLAFGVESDGCQWWLWLDQVRQQLMAAVDNSRQWRQQQAKGGEYIFMASSLMESGSPYPCARKIESSRGRSMHQQEEQKSSTQTQPSNQALLRNFQISTIRCRSLSDLRKKVFDPGQRNSQKFPIPLHGNALL